MSSDTRRDDAHRDLAAVAAGDGRLVPLDRLGELVRMGWLVRGVDAIALCRRGRGALTEAGVAEIEGGGR